MICLVWLIGWVFTYNLSGSGFDSSYSHLTFITDIVHALSKEILDSQATAECRFTLSTYVSWWNTQSTQQISIHNIAQSFGQFGCGFKWLKFQILCLLSTRSSMTFKQLQDCRFTLQSSLSKVFLVSIADLNFVSSEFML